MSSSNKNNVMTMGKICGVVICSFLISFLFQGQPAQAADTKAEITKAYKEILGREPDKAGLDYFVNDMKNGQSIGDVRRNLANSEENKNRVSAVTKANPEITKIYQDVLGRTPDKDGLKYWADAKKNGMSIDDIRRSIANSDENKEYVKQDMEANPEVAREYQTILGRLPDKPGLKYWSQAVKDGLSMEDLRRCLANSEENRIRVNTVTKANPELTKAYKELLGRVPDKAGLEYWANEMKKGMSIEEVRRNMTNSLENNAQLKKTMDANPEIAKAYREMLGRLPDKGGMEYWVKAAKDGMSIGDIRKSMANSEENKELMKKDIEANPEIAKAYQEMLGRIPDKAGMEYWVKAAKDGMSIGDIRKNMANSEENKELMKKDIEANPEIAKAYQEMLGRTPDKAGMEYWVKAANDGMSIGDIRKSMANSEENKARMKKDIEANPEIAKAYEDVLGRLPDKDGLDYWVKAAKDGMSVEDIRRSMAESDEKKKASELTPAAAPSGGPVTGTPGGAGTKNDTTAEDSLN